MTYMMKQLKEYIISSIRRNNN